MICGASWEILIVLEDLVKGKVKLWWIMEVKRKGNLINIHVLQNDWAMVQNAPIQNKL